MNGPEVLARLLVGQALEAADQHPFGEPYDGLIKDVILANGTDRLSIFNHLLEGRADAAAIRQCVFDADAGHPKKSDEDGGPPLELLPDAGPEWPRGVLLAPWLEAYVWGLSESLQVPVVMTALGVLTVVSVAVQRLVRVQPRPGWIEPTNTYSVTSAEVGERKSAVTRATTRPLLEWERAHKPEQDQRIAREGQSRGLAATA
jgi:hypothetical protein